MSITAPKKPNQAQLYKLFNPPLEPVDTIGACLFMKLLSDLHKRYVMPLRREYNEYYSKEREHVPSRVRRWRSRFSYTFADGVYVDSMPYYQRDLAVLRIELTLQEPCMRVYVLDFRFKHGLRDRGVARRFEQSLNVPFEFYQLLFLHYRVNPNGWRDWSYETFKRYVRMALGNQKIHTFDRAAKLRALATMCAV